eukprot:s4822_g4.t1
MADDESECSSIDSDADSDCSTDDEAIGHEVIQVDVETLAEDEHRAVKVEFAKHKERLKAQIMKDMARDEEDGDRVAYVRLPGTSKVAEVAFYDGEDEMMERNVSSTDSKKVIEKGTFRCMVQPVILRKKIKFLMDTGCGHDLISQKKIEKTQLGNAGDTGTYLISDSKWRHRHRSGVQLSDGIVQGTDQCLRARRYTIGVVNRKTVRESQLRIRLATRTGTIHDRS